MDDAIDRSTPAVAVLGCGGWGKNIVRTLRAIQPIPVIADPCDSGRATASELAPDAVVTGDPAVIFDDPAIDAVMIATPAETHFELARRAIEAGKDVFVEKPLTIDLDEARTLVDLAKRHGRVLMVGHLLEYHPAILKLHDLIKRGELGEVRYVISNRLNLGKVRTHENALWSFAPHDIAVILRLVGQDPTEIVATGGSYVSPGIADVTVTQLLFPKGVRSHVFVSWLHPFKEQRLVVVGSKKMASFDDVNKELVLYDQRVDLEEGQPVPVKGEGVAVEFDTETSPLEAEVRHFIERVIDRQPPRTHGASGVKVLEILHAAQESIGQGGGAISLVEERPIVEAKPEATHARV